MPKQVNPERNPSNPKWKTISLPYTTVIILNEFVDNHPEEGYSGVSDVIVSILRESPVFKRATVEYMDNHDLKHWDEEEIKRKFLEAQEYRKKVYDALLAYSPKQTLSTEEIIKTLDVLRKRFGIKDLKEIEAK